MTGDFPLLQRLILLPVLHCLTACVSTPKPVAHAPDTTPRWTMNQDAYDAARPRNVHIEINLADKTARLLDHTDCILITMDCSPGIAEHPTPAGSFRVKEKLPVKHSNLYGQFVDAKTGDVVVPRTWEHTGPRPPGTVYRGIAMPFWLRLTDGGVGMHVGGFDRGVSTSHGCIRCLEDPQRLIYEKVTVGTAVTITPP